MGVYKKGNRWYIDYYQPDGKRKRESVTIEGIDPSKITRTDADKALSIRKAEIAQGKFNIVNGNKKLPFKNLVEKYLDWANENHRVPKRDYYACQQLLRYFDTKNTSNINLWDIEKYKSKRKSEGRKPETINRELGTLRRMYNLAVEWKMLPTNPIHGMKLLKVPKYQPRVLRDWEFQKLYEAAAVHFKPILLCAYMTGMRRGEIAFLKWVNVDLEDRYIHVVETKNDDYRSIPINDLLFKTLIDLKYNQKSENVFLTHEGNTYRHNSLWKRAWSTALKKSGIEKCRFHDLRHTFVSNLIVTHKEDFATVMALSGHKDISMLKRYSHTREEAKRAAINKLTLRINSNDYKVSSIPLPIKNLVEIS